MRLNMPNSPYITAAGALLLVIAVILLFVFVALKG